MRRYHSIYQYRLGTSSSVGPRPFPGRYPTRLNARIYTGDRNAPIVNIYTKPSPQAWLQLVKLAGSLDNGQELLVTEFDMRSTVQSRRVILGLHEPLNVNMSLVGYYYLLDRTWLPAMPLSAFTFLKVLRTREGSIYYCPRLGTKMEDVHGLARRHTRGDFRFGQFYVTDTNFLNKVLLTMPALVNPERETLLDRLTEANAARRMGGVPPTTRPNTPSMSIVVNDRQRITMLETALQNAEMTRQAEVLRQQVPVQNIAFNQSVTWNVPTWG